MSRIDAHLRRARARDGRKALIPYVTAGDPHADTTAAIMQALVAAGADVIELGVPFSDPMADGPVIQGERARAGARRRPARRAGDGARVPRRATRRRRSC